MTYPEHLTIATIGDEDLVNGMRLAGISRYYLVEGGRDVRADVRRSLTELVSNPEIGVIVIQEEYAEFAEDMISSARVKKSMAPVIIQVPSKYGTKFEDVRAYYKTYIKRFIGFDVEI